jgi:hypothetical protein
VTTSPFLAALLGGARRGVGFHCAQTGSNHQHGHDVALQRWVAEPSIRRLKAVVLRFTPPAVAGLCVCQIEMHAAPEYVAAKRPNPEETVHIPESNADCKRSRTTMLWRDTVNLGALQQASRPGHVQVKRSKQRAGAKSDCLPCSLPQTVSRPGISSLACVRHMACRQKLRGVRRGHTETKRSGTFICSNG